MQIREHYICSDIQISAVGLYNTVHSIYLKEEAPNVTNTHKHTQINTNHGN